MENKAPDQNQKPVVDPSAKNSHVPIPPMEEATDNLAPPPEVAPPPPPSPTEAQGDPTFPGHPSSSPAPPPPPSAPKKAAAAGFLKRDWKKPLLAAAAVLLLVLIYFLWPKATVSSEPGTAKIIFSGHTKKAGTIWILPYKNYLVRVEQDGFLPFEKTVKVGFGGRSRIVAKLNSIPKPRLLAQGVGQLISLGPKEESVNFLSPDNQAVFRVLRKPPFKEFETPFQLNLAPLPVIKKLIFSSDQNFVVILQGDEAGILDLRRRDVTSQDFVALGGGLSDIALAKDNQTIYYFFSDPKTGEKSLIKDTIQKTNPDRLFDQSRLPEPLLNNPRLFLSPKEDKLLLLADRAFLINLQERTGKALSEEAPKDALFSPDGGRLLIFNQANEVLVYKSSGELEGKLDFKAEAARFVFSSANRAVFVSGNQLLGYDFDSKAKIVYTTADTSPQKISQIIVDKEGKTLFVKTDTNLFELALLPAVSTDPTGGAK